MLALIANSRADSHKIGMESDMYGTSLQGLNLSFYQDSALTHAVVMHMVSFCDYSSGEREIDEWIKTSNLRATARLQI